MIITEAPRPGMPYAVRAGLGNPQSLGGFHDDDQVARSLRDAARCGEVTAYGMPWMEWCGARSVAGTDRCPEHQPDTPAPPPEGRWHRRLNATMEPGNMVWHGGTTVVMIGEVQPWRDRFGRDMYRCWAVRDDTGAEGWMMFGWSEDSGQ